MTNARSGRQLGWAYIDASGQVVYRASSFGSCTRSLTAARLGEDAFPFHATIQAAMDVSSGLEDELLRRASLELNDGSIIWQQKEVELPVGTCIIRGHIDGLHQQSDTVIEAKALSTRNYDAYVSGGMKALGKLSEKYLVQAAIYGYATQRKVRFVIGEKVNNDRTQALNDSMAAEGLVESVKFPEWDIGRVDIGPPVDPSTLHSLDAIIDKVHRIEDHASRDELPDCDGGCREGDPYSECHLFAGPTVGDADLEKKLLRYDELKQLLGDEGDERKPGWGLLGEMAQLKDDIKEQYGDPYDTKKYTVGPFTASIIPNKGRAYIDRKWLKENHPDIEAQATKLGKGFHTLIVKRAKSHND